MARQPRHRARHRARAGRGAVPSYRTRGRPPRPHRPAPRTPSRTLRRAVPGQPTRTGRPPRRPRPPPRQEEAASPEWRDEAPPGSCSPFHNPLLDRFVGALSDTALPRGLNRLDAKRDGPLGEAFSGDGIPLPMMSRALDHTVRDVGEGQVLASVGTEPLQAQTITLDRLGVVALPENLHGLHRLVA